MKLLFAAEDVAEAQMLKLALDEAGITCHVQQDIPAFVVFSSPNTFPKQQVYVNAEDMQAAEDVLEQFLRRAFREGEGARWQCPECGEEVEGVFDVCWNCQAERPTS